MPILPIYHSLGPTVCGGVSMCESGWIPFVVVVVVCQMPPTRSEWFRKQKNRTKMTTTTMTVQMSLSLIDTLTRTHYHHTLSICLFVCLFPDSARHIYKHTNSCSSTCTTTKPYLFQLFQHGLGTHGGIRLHDHSLGFHIGVNFRNS